MSETGARTPRELKERIDTANRGDAFLVFRDGEDRQAIIVLPVDGRGIVVGRSADVDLSLAFDGEVSRLHAQMERLGSEWVVADEGFSRNGTFVNGEKVVGRRRLRDGDVLRFGSTLVEFRDPSASPEDRTLAASSPTDRGPIPEGRRRVLVALCAPMLTGDGMKLPPSNIDIAEQLFISVDTVKSHMRALFEHFEIGDESRNVKRVMLAEQAIREGAVTAQDLTP